MLFQINRLTKAEEYFQWETARENMPNPLWISAVRAEIAHGHRLVFICVGDGKYCGRCELLVKHCDPDYTIPDRRIHLTLLDVLPVMENQGIGSSLVEYIFEYCRTIGYAEISVGVNLDNDVARHLYEKKGFTCLIGEGEDEDGRYAKLLKKLGTITF